MEESRGQAGQRGDVMDLIAAFLREESKCASLPCTVFLCGSHARGEAGPRSDIDLCCAGEFPAFSRGSDWFLGVEFQWMAAPWEWYEDVVRRHDRSGNVGTITAMVAQGVFLRGDELKFQQLQELAQSFFAKGPEPADDSEIRRLRVRLTALWANWQDAEGDMARKWLACHLVSACVETHFRLRGWWAVKPKDQLAQLEQRDPQVARKVYAALSSDEAALEWLCHHVLEQVGGLMREPWRA